MNETIGSTIRKLRKEKDITQEELAELLGVTSQAVSKWESGAGLPDISQLVPLANVFEVPMDTLFGRTSWRDDEEVERIIEEIEQMDNRQFASEEEHRDVELVMYERYKDALKLYPNNTKLLGAFAAHGHCVVQEWWDIMAAEQRDKMIGECIHANEMVLKYSSDLNEILSAKRWMIGTYCLAGQFGEAEKTVETLPNDLDTISGIRLAELKFEAGLEDEERILRCYNIKALLSALEHQVVMLGNHYGRTGAFEDAVYCHAFLREMVKSLYREEEYVPPFHVAVFYLYIFPAKYLVKLGRYEEAIDLLEECVTYEENQAKHYNIREKVDSPLFRDCVFRFFGKSYTRTMKPGFLESCKFFKPIADHPRYIALLERVNAAK